MWLVRGVQAVNMANAKAMSVQNKSVCIGLVDNKVEEWVFSDHETAVVVYALILDRLKRASSSVVMLEE